jgi:hypothetical protein
LGVKIDKLYVLISYFDEQYDVEAFHYLASTGAYGERIDELSDFGFESDDQAYAFAKNLMENYDVVEIKRIDVLDDEISADAPSVFTGDVDFWDLIDRSLSETSTMNAQRKWLISYLAKCSDETISSFESFINDTFSRIRSNPNYMRAYRLAGIYGGDDSVYYFGGYLISRGKKDMERILADPMVIEEFDANVNEAFLYIAHYAEQEKYAMNG